MTEVRRSMLQRKGRNELMQIAAALGGKPSNRARKEQVIQLIIDLTTGSTASASIGGAEAASSDSASTTGSNAGQASRSHAKAANRRTGTSAAKVVSADSSGTEAAGNHAASSSSTSAEQARSENRAALQTEPGNRRRRRRARDRDRDHDEGWSGDSIDVEGMLDLRDEGYGFLRVDGCLPNRNDAYVPVKTIRQFGLRRGDHLRGTSRPANRAEKNPALLTLLSVNGGPPEQTGRPFFERLTPVHAARQLALERPDDPDNLTARLIDLIAPIGLGQRVLVWAPRRSGATDLLAALVSAIETNEPDVYVMGLFLDQRPEEITEVSRSIRNGEVVATAFDQPAEEHVQTAEMTVERAKRLAEDGRDVAVVLDGLTTLARAYNTMLANVGKSYSGRVESGAIHMPKKLFGVGRNLAEAGSVTMIAVISTDTPRLRSLDGVLLDEFAGTANTEIHLDRWAAERGMFPAVDVLASTSRDERRFMEDHELRALETLRQAFAEHAGEGPGSAVAALEAVLARLRSTSANAELLARV